MSKLKAVLDSIDDLPEPIQELYSKKGDKFELTGIEGVKTPADVERLTKTLNTEREAHKATKAKLAAFGDLEPEEVQAKLDKYDELEATSGGKVDDEKIAKLVEARVKSQIGPKDRELKKLQDENATLRADNETLRSGERKRLIHDHVRTAAQKSKLLDTATEDALFMAERVFDVDENGVVITRDNVGVTPGLDAEGWLQEIQPKRPHWWPATQGSGGKGSGGSGGYGASNPWSADAWNLTRKARPSLRRWPKARALRLAVRSR
jgi:regulator of replication initiation timing